MQVALLVPETEWRDLLSKVQRLEAVHAAATSAPPPDEILTVRQAATFLSMTAEGIRKARRAGRLSGIRRNEKEWGFRRSVIEQYLRRYDRSAT